MAGPAHLWVNSFQMFPPCCVDSGSLLFNLKSLPQGLGAEEQTPDGESAHLGLTPRSAVTGGPFCADSLF